MNFNLNWYRNHEGSKLNNCFLLKFQGFNLTFIIPVPVEVKLHTVPHFKAPINGKVEPRRPEHGGIFIS